MNKEFTLLTEDQVFENKIGLIKKVSNKCAVTDFAILLGACIPGGLYVDYDHSLKGRIVWYYLSSVGGVRDCDVRVVTNFGDKATAVAGDRAGGVRPVLPLSAISDISLNGERLKKGIFKNFFSSKVEKDSKCLEIEYGEYPQYVVSTSMESELEQAYRSGTIRKTGKTYTTDSRKWNYNSSPFKAVEHEEYEYNGKKYIRAYYRNTDIFTLSNGKQYKEGDNVWIEVSPLKWYVDYDARIMLCKNLVVSGIRFCNDHSYDGNFKNTEMYKFLNTYFARDIEPSTIHQMQQKEEISELKESRKEIKKRENPYRLNFGQVSEEEIIRGSIESGVAVFLHGASSEGKSARVKQIDPDTVIIYLRNATPESLNGKSVYNAQKGEMIDIKPSWLKKLEAKCEAEPDKLHIVFFDEITNALPSIQGIAFNIVLDREVNGMWQLPENARIVAAGNEMKDSLAANQLAEPLFNRFAHVYIKTTTEGWLKWASEHNIHPAIYSYIAYKKGETLRSKYDGEKPNADPRKWEMASKMLYATGSPEMLRALVGEDITREFVEFCNQQVITLDDVINGNYSERDIQSLNTAERYATTMGLSQVDEENMEKVRNFVINLGAEFGAVFDSLWAHGDESRLELIAEVRLADLGGRKI